MITDWNVLVQQLVQALHQALGRADCGYYGVDSDWSCCCYFCYYCYRLSVHIACSSNIQSPLTPTITTIALLIWLQA